MAVDAADHDVKLGERVFGEIHFAVAFDVAFEAGENAEREAGAVQIANLFGESHCALFIQAVGHGERFGMIGDGDVFVAERVGGLGHFLERGAAVGFGGVHVQVAADVGEFDEFGQAVFERGFDFAAVLAQLGRNPGEAEGGVNFLFGFAGDALATLSVGIELEQAVFIEREAKLQGAAAHQDVVLLAAGEILHGCAVAFLRERAQIHLQAVEPILDAGFVSAFAEDAVRFGMLRRIVRGRLPRLGR